MTRVLTTHTGSLPRPADLAARLTGWDQGGDSVPPALVREAVEASVRDQLDAGIDVISDGEMSKFGYATYVKERLTGFGGTADRLALADLADFPGHARGFRLEVDTPACVGPVTYRGTDAVNADIENLRSGLKADGDGDIADVFVGAASPGVIAMFLSNSYYGSAEEYVFALAEAMKTEYDAIHRTGFQVQLDCPDLAMGRHVTLPPMEIEAFRRQAEMHVEAMNYAVRDIPEDRLRMHLCWGNYAAPHHHDIPLIDIIDIVLRARPSTLLLEAANPRHEHEWRVFEDVTLPDDKILAPGVIDTLSSYVEHPDLIAERISRYVSLLGPQRVLAGADCGFATFANFVSLDPAIAWSKLRALSIGAKRASRAASA